MTQNEFNRKVGEEVNLNSQVLKSEKHATMQELIDILKSCGYQIALTMTDPDGEVISTDIEDDYYNELHYAASYVAKGRR